MKSAGATSSIVHQAATVRGPERGNVLGANSVGTALVYFNLSSFAGSFVRVSSSDERVYVLFVESATPATTPTTTATSLSAVSAGCMDWVNSGDSEQFLVPSDNPYLACRTSSGTTRVRVRKAG